MDVAAIVKDFVQANVLSQTDVKEVSPDDSLLDAGLIDSVGIFELVSHLEKECGVKIEDEELVPDNFDSINNIVEFVNRKRQN